MEAYFDNSATTIVTDSVKDIVVKTMTEDFGNPSAMLMVGVKAEKYIKEAQENIAKILKVDQKESFFTSGGTESNNMAIIGTAMANKRKGNKIITTSVEHSSVLATMKYLEEQGFEVIYLPVDRYGVVQMEALEKEMTEDTILVSTMYVNNEVGAIEPVGEIGQYIKKVNLPMLVTSIVVLVLNLILKPQWSNHLQTTYVGISSFFILVYISKYFDNKFFQKVSSCISKYSYAIFLVHHVIIAQVMARVDLTQISWFGSYKLFALCCIIIGICAFLLFQIHKYIMKFIKGKMLCMKKD